MHKVNDFIKFALSHAEKSTIPAGATLPLPIGECGTDPWHYLFGSVRVQTTADTLARYRTAYVGRGWNAETFDYYTQGWRPTDYATDCQGLLDAWLTYECGEKTDINADMNYKNWCTNKGKIQDITRPYVIGEAVFTQSNKTGKMTHVGWVCGFDTDGCPLILEARGLRYGVVVTRLVDRNFTHRGLMLNKFYYGESEETEMTKFELTSPIQTGDTFKAMQVALNAAGYTDADGKALTEDGKWGKRSQEAFNRLLEDHSPTCEMPTSILSDDAVTLLMRGIRITIEKDGEEG